MKNEKPVIIIKKVRKRHHGRSHGGSWKVAYADFVTAMMAFFLVLWLISMISPEKRARVANYYKHFSVFTESGTSFMDKTSELFSETGEAEEKIPAELQGSFNNMARDTVKGEIKKAIEEKLSDIEDQVIVDIFEGGIRIQLVDKEGKSMFDLGSSELTPIALRILHVIGDNIKSLPNAVAIEGHTDSLAYSSTRYSNWDLSTERALTARKALEKHGLTPDRVTRVAGYSDTVPFIKENTEDPRNRRISILLMFPEK